MQKNFEQLKHLLATTPILRIAKSEKEFMVCTDVCKEEVGEVLIQDSKVVAWVSEFERTWTKYSAYDLELTTVFHALKMWWHYFLRKKILLMTNHSSLTNYFK